MDASSRWESWLINWSPSSVWIFIGWLAITAPPPKTLDDALAAIRTEAISAAIITMIADGIYTDMVARELARQNVPFAVTPGIGTSPSHPELHGAPAIIKPFQTVHVQAILADLLGMTTDSPTLKPPG